MAKTKKNAAPPKFKGSGREKSLSPKQIRARARRHGKISQAEMDALYKPLEEWDEEELARGRPRAADGTFRGKPPPYITREVYEEAISRFNTHLKDKMRAETPGAMKRITELLMDDERDERGKPVVPASVQLQAAMWLVEHAVGKPTTHAEVDISVKLQAVLAAATAGPEGFALAELESPDVIEGDAWEDDDLDVDSNA